MIPMTIFPNKESQLLINNEQVVITSIQNNFIFCPLTHDFDRLNVDLIFEILISKTIKIYFLLFGIFRLPM